MICQPASTNFWRTHPSLKSHDKPNCTVVQSTMYEELDDRADSIRVWRDSELLDGSLCSKCLEFHGLYAPCIPSTLPIDAVSFPPRAIKSGMNGSLSLHDYRKYLLQSAECIDDPVDRSEKTLKRKTAKSNLNRPPPLSSSSSSSRAASVSSATSSPPPLSPSCSHSVISHQSEPESDLPETQDQNQGSLLFYINSKNKALTPPQLLRRVHECILSRKTPPVQDLIGSDW